MPFRLINVASLGVELSNVMLHSSGSGDASLEAFHQRGGNCLHLHDEGDSTDGRCATGEWLRRRKIRDRIFLCSAVCHDGWNEATQQPIDRFTPAALAEDIGTELELLGTDHLDLVYLSDNPRSPLEPMIDALAREIRRGRVRHFGVSNWSIDRLREADRYAKRSGGFSPRAIVTTELALARQSAPLWPEYLPFDASFSAFVREQDLAVFAHLGDLNQGQCLFSDENSLARMKPEWVRRWNTSTNASLVKRVRDFASAHQLTTREVNAASVLNQDFPVVGIVSSPVFAGGHGCEYERAAGITLSETDRRQLRGNEA